MIRFIIKIYIYLLILDVVLGFFPQYHNHPWVRSWIGPLKKCARLSLDPVRQFMPRDLPFDFSPLVVIFLLNLLMFLW
jgi:YggT family protein